MYRQVEDVTNAGPLPAPVCASPPVPVSVVNVVELPAITGFVAGAAVGVSGADTEAVIVEYAFWPTESLTPYLIAVAVPVKLGNGLNDTVPSAFTMYVPSPVTSSVVAVHATSAVPVRQILTLDATSVAPLAATLFDSGEIVCVTSHAPGFVSGDTVGGTGTDGVNVLVAVAPNESVT